MQARKKKKGILGFFKKKGDQLDAMKMKYNKAETNVEKIQSMLEGHQVQLLKDIAMLDKMYELNMAYFKELSMYILAGKKKLADVRANELQQAMDKAKASGLPEDAQAARDLADQCERFEKKLYDLELTRNIQPADGAADPPAAEQRHHDGREDPVHHRQHHPPVEEPDGAGTGSGPQPAGHAGRACRDRHDQRPAQEERRGPEDGYHRDRKGEPARCGGYRDPAADQQEPDRDAGRAEQDPERGRASALPPSRS